MMKSPQLARFTRLTRHQDDEPCRNCDAVYSGNFCSQCGQEAYTGAPTTVGFIYEFLTRNIFERGKVPRTLWHLLRYPGGLTVDFLEGRRQRFIRPVRLYFALSVLYFLFLTVQNSDLVKYAANDLLSSKQADAAEGSVPAPVKTLPRPLIRLDMGTRPKANDAGKVVLDHAGKVVLDHNGARFDDSLFKLLGLSEKQISDSRVWQELRLRVRRINDLSEQELQATLLKGALDQAPKAMFFLVPVFALFLKILFLFRRIPYGAHLLFAFHYHSMVFLGLLFLLFPAPAFLTALAILLGGCYLPLAMRTTYLCGWFGALTRSLVLLLMYAMVIGLAFTGAIAITLLQ